MFKNPSLATRIAVGKGVGFLIGLTAFIFIPYYLPEHSAALKWGVFLWYITFGAIIGVFGVYTKIPVINIAVPWWIRGAYVGAWLNFVISLVAYDALEQLMVSVFGENGLISSPFWVVLEGIIFGFVIDFLATKFGGEGGDTLN
jgi:hypothetical protein